jgi:predicted small lipoprotein YifL
MRTLSLIFALAAALALSACGYKTPLALPKPEAATPKPAAVPTAPAAAPDTAKPDAK